MLNLYRFYIKADKRIIIFAYSNNAIFTKYIQNVHYIYKLNNCTLDIIGGFKNKNLNNK